MIKTKPFIISLVIPLAIGALSGVVTSGSMERYAQMAKPPLAPPSWLFPVVWTILFILMGIASYLIYMSGNPEKKSALFFYGAQLVVNFIWPIIFFNFGKYLFAFIWLMFLWVWVIIMNVKFYRINRSAGLMIIPYVIWLTFAAYLNFFAYYLN